MRCIAQLIIVGVFFMDAVLVNPSQAITINLDYTYDTSDFFGAGNPNGEGVKAKQAIEAAADYFSAILEDTFSEIETPAKFTGSFGGMVVWQWDLSFSNPYTGATTTLYDETIAEDEFRIYVGARSLAGTTLGQGGPGGWGWSSTPSGGFTSGEIDQIDAITDDFAAAVGHRKEYTGFARWGGALTFDSDASTDWHYDHKQPTPAGKDDLFSVAIHEIAHALGLGTSTDWDANTSNSGTLFSGPNAQAEYGGMIPLDCSGGCTGHWQEGISSDIHGTSISQEAAMDPSITEGTRKYFTNLDAAASVDIGWDVTTITPGDFDFDGDVDDDDYATFESSFASDGGGDTDFDVDTDGIDFLTWQQHFDGSASPAIAASIIPEPNSALLMLLGTGILIRKRTR